MKYNRRKRNKKNRNKILFAIIILIIVINCIKEYKENSSVKTSENLTKEKNELQNSIDEDSIYNDNEKGKTEDWKLILVNNNNKLPKSYSISLSSIDEYRKFDSRAIRYLKEMLNDMRNSGITNIWVQSAYRSIEEQERIYNSEVEKYMNQGKTRKQAQVLTEETINKPGYSEHNLGLAVDFNYVNGEFENTDAFRWLKENAEKYGFILRYPKEKENITKVKYEPWHWRYVGKENAKNINEKNMCLEEYIDFLKN